MSIFWWLWLGMVGCNGDKTQIGFKHDLNQLQELDSRGKLSMMDSETRKIIRWILNMAVDERTMVKTLELG